MDGKRLEGTFLLVIADVRKVNKIYRSVKMAGLEIDGIYMQSVASAESVLSEGQKKAGTVVIDIGGGTSDLLIVNKGVIRFTGVIPYGGDYVTNEIQKTLKLLPDTAEYLKIRHGTTFSKSIPDDLVYNVELGWNNAKKSVKARLLSQIIERKMELIASYIRQFIETYQNNFANEELLAGVILTGGGSQIKHIKQFMELKLGREVELGIPVLHLASNNFTQEISAPLYSTVLGLLKMSLERDKEKRKESLYEMVEARRRQETSAEPGEIFDEDDFSDNDDQQPENQKKASKKSLFGNILDILKSTIIDSK
jgi:cell division protein FtsA